MNAIVTVCIGKNYEEMFILTRPTIEAYANKIGAEFVHINEQQISQTSYHFEKFQLHNLFNKYERIIYVDADLIIRDDCPDLFNIVPQDKIGLFNEGRFKNRLEVLFAASKAYNIKLDEKELPNFYNKYYNTGVMVISRRHRELFKKPVIEDIYNHYEQSYLNLLIIKDNIKVHELTHEYNRMQMMDDILGEHRLNSYIVHYAGILQNVTKVINQDLERWHKGIKKIQRRVILAAGARLGDIVSAEPIIRYMVNNEYTDAKITIVSTEPRVFAHLADKAEITSFEQHIYEQDMPYITHNAMVPQESDIWRHMTANAMHTVDWMSVVCLKHTIPDNDKCVNLGLSLDGFKEVMDITGSNINDLNQMVLIHPGRGWPSKTFPAAFWNQIINGLVENKFKVGIIGKEVNEEFGTVNIDIPDGVIDFRDLLSLDGLFTLIAKASILISNDSSPIHIAGAFDNYIILIPTCKHPDFILPWRNNDKYHKATAIYNKLMCNEPAMKPSNHYDYQLKKIPDGHDISEYLPNPQHIIDKVKVYQCTTPLSP